MTARCVFLCCVVRILSVTSTTHSLIYIYTALSTNSRSAALPNFTAIGLVDGRPYDRFDSVNPKRIPTVKWARERLYSDYWDKGTKSRVMKQQWFHKNLHVMMARTGHSVSDGDIHVLQGLHGCYGETSPTEERLQFVRGVDKYAYDGDDLLSFDFERLRWSAAVEAAKPTVKKWNGVPALPDYTNGYFRNECINWLTTFVKYSKREVIDRTGFPDLYVFAGRNSSSDIVTLICMASVFTTTTIAMKLMRNDRVLNADDGITVFDVLPNDEYTFQTRIAVDILSSDTGNYTCEFFEQDTGYHIVKHWRAGDRSLVRSNAGVLWVLLTTTACLTAALCAVLCVAQKRRTAESGNGKDGGPQHHGFQHETLV
ncbi:H-2 class I histocompatibility antigen, L-D alpha chain-like [Pelmatolapia mariae]|uniref:H-2 class I histocompatibility antigen, L-D alpha chain-like n=1 Tax=Pelmatolapia mariae TaxID=158779 RepID=UPI002FE66B62